MAATIFCVVVIIFGAYILSQTLLAIIIYGFQDEMSKELEEAAAHKRKRSSLLRFVSKKGHAIGDSASFGDHHLDATWKEKEIPYFDRSSAWGNSSLFLFSLNNPFRQRMKRMIHHVIFRRAISFLVLLSVVTIALEKPSLRETDRLLIILRQLDVVWCCVFIVELILKMVADGAIAGDTAYLRKGWGMFDLVCVVVSIIGITPIGMKAYFTFDIFSFIISIRFLRHNA